MSYSIYKIVCAVDGKLYIGLTGESVKARWRRHRYDARRLAPKPLYRAIAKHGLAQFSIEVLEEAPTKEEAQAREIFWIARLGTRAPAGYNITDGGEACSGASRPDVARRNRERCTGKPLSESHRKSVGDAHRGMKRSAETRERISASKRGKPRPDMVEVFRRLFKGKPWSEARRLAAQKGKA